MSFDLVAGDLEPDLRLVLDVNGAPEDISDNDGVLMRWIKPDGTVVERELTEDTDGGGFEAGAVKLVWVDGDTDIVGTHKAIIEVTRGNGELQTFPSDGSAAKWSVHRRAGT